MTPVIHQIQADFDQLAAFANDGWDHNSHYYPVLLKYLPAPCTHALEIGCGTGGFARVLATRGAPVVALDLSPRMIALARQRTPPEFPIDFQVADVMQGELPAAHFDCIVSIATAHHLPFDAFIAKIIPALTDCGVLLLLDLFEPVGFVEQFISACAVPLNIVLRLFHGLPWRDSDEVRCAWAAHGAHETYLTLPQLRQHCARWLPGVQINRHLLWRYSLIWQKNWGDKT
jgi:SAM-dependent methyltransferase